MRLTKQQFIDLFTPEEMQGILAAAKQSVAVEAWLFRFNSLTPNDDGTSVDMTDARTVSGLQALELGGLLGEGRSTEIIASAGGGLTSYDGLSVGQVVNVKPPFDSFGTQTITAIKQSIDGGVSFALGAAGAFDRVYLEPVE